MLEICGKKIIEHVVEIGEKVSNSIVVATSRHTRITRDWCKNEGLDVIELSGADYVEDLRFVLKAIRSPVLLLPADAPFITSDLIREFLSIALKLSYDVITLCTPIECFLRHQDVRSLSLTDRLQPTGISLFKRDGDGWTNVIMCRYPELLNVNTEEELKLARVLCSKRLQ